MTTEEIKEVWQMLKDREIHPSGTFDGAGRFSLAHRNLAAGIRTPSRRWPMSEMKHGRTLKYVKKVAEKFGCTSKEEILKVL